MAQKAFLMFNGESLECEFFQDASGEYIFKAEDGRFVKFPKSCDLEKAVEKHNKANGVERPKPVKKEYSKKQANY